MKQNIKNNIIITITKMEKTKAYIRGTYHVKERCNRRYLMKTTERFLIELKAISVAKKELKSRVVRRLVNEEYERLTADTQVKANNN